MFFIYNNSKLLLCWHQWFCKIRSSYKKFKDHWISVPPYILPECCHCTFSMLAAKVKLMIQIWGLLERRRGAPPTTPLLIEVIRKPEPCRKQILSWLLLPSSLIVFKVVVHCWDMTQIRSPKSGADAKNTHKYLHNYIQNVHFLLTHDFCRYLRKTENKNLLRTFLINVRSFSTFAIILLCMMYFCSCSKSKLLRL